MVHEKDFKNLSAFEKLDLISELVEYLKGNINDSENYDFEKDLLVRGFSIDIEKDERTTLHKENLYITLHHDSDNVDDNYHSDFISIFFLKKGSSNFDYRYKGKNPKNNDELEKLFSDLYLTEYL